MHPAMSCHMYLIGYQVPSLRRQFYSRAAGPLAGPLAVRDSVWVISYSAATCQKQGGAAPRVGNPGQPPPASPMKHLGLVCVAWVRLQQTLCASDAGMCGTMPGLHSPCSFAGWHPLLRPD